MSTIIQSLATGIVPIQWKTAVITPVAEVRRPTKPSDYRPISVTPVLSRHLEKLMYAGTSIPVVTSAVYPVQLQRSVRISPVWLNRCSSNHSVTQYALDADVHVFAFDFPKAFETLMNKMATLELHDK